MEILATVSRRTYTIALEASEALHVLPRYYTSAQADRPARVMEIQDLTLEVGYLTDVDNLYLNLTFTARVQLLSPATTTYLSRTELTPLDNHCLEPQDKLRLEALVRDLMREEQAKLARS